MAWHTTTELDSTHFICSVGQEEVFSLTSYLDIIQSERQKSKNIHETSCSQDSETDTCRSSPSGTTWQPSTEIPGADQLTFFAEDSPAKTSVRRVKEQELPESVRAYGRNMRDSLARCGLDLSLPKTHHCFALGDLELSSKIWPRWGIMLDGECSELGMSVRRTSATECGSWRTPSAQEPEILVGRLKTKTGEPVESMCRHYDKHTERMAQIELSPQVKAKATWPTPTCQETEHPAAVLTSTGRRLSKDGKSSHSLNLADSVMRRPTTATRNYKETNDPERFIRKDSKSRIDQLPNAVAYSGTPTPQKWGTPRCFMYKDALTDRGKGNLGEQVNEAHKMKKTGQLNPSWVEVLMGWPQNWTNISHSNLTGFNEWLVAWNEKEKHTNETVPNMLKLDRSKEKRKEAEEFQDISTEEILLSFVYEYEAESNQIGMALQGKEISEKEMQVLWDWGKASGSPYRQELQTRCGEKLSDFMHLVSQVYPSYGKKAWQDGTWEFATPRVAHDVKDRVSRLKAIGNGQVSKCAAVAFQVLSQELD